MRVFPVFLKLKHVSKMRRNILDLGERLAASESSRGAARAFEKWTLLQPWRPSVQKKPEFVLISFLVNLFLIGFPAEAKNFRFRSSSLLTRSGSRILQLALCLQHHVSLSSVLVWFVMTMI